MDKIRDAAASLKALTTSSHKYRPIPLRLTEQKTRHHLLEDEPRPRSRFFKVSTAIMLFAVFLLLGLAFAHDRKETVHCVNSKTASCRYDARKHWGQYSPYFSAPRGSIKSDVPSGCKVTFASVLSRHGSRYPTKSKSKAYKDLIGRIQRDAKSYGKGYEFIKYYNYSLGADDLTRHGEHELYQSGKKFMKRYKKLAKESTHPFVRASGSDRVIKSAEWFLRGFYKGKSRNGDKYLSDIFVIPERKGFNNPLDHGNCKAFEDARHSSLAGEQKNAWREIWATPIMNRLNKQLPGANLSLDDAISMMDLCPFNTVTSVKTRLSPFCRLFSRSEWEGYEYYESVDKWYAYGPGHPLAPTQGVGYVNELIARLTKAPVKDNTTTNSTLDSNPTTFPLDRLLYADFSHDNTLMTVYGALGLYTNDTVLPSDRMLPPTKTGGYSASWAVPFGARMYVEKMHCGEDADELVRVLVNDRVVAPKGCRADKLGRCKVDDFLKGLEFAKKGGHWDQC
ncbi:hypothetical protein E4U43_000889 [Claviceps pusilla]|uniref:Phytase A n=1 Tax=Claviceps pusilla TaxID=123648 RepID=A0A9P7NAS4_9HYPO|nr:hypothetical protein E4U43_000889 [Claviceps pusilla]